MYLTHFVFILQGCGGDKEADIIFVFDEAVFGREESARIKQFISSVVQELSMNSGKVRVGVVSKTCHEGQDINLNSVREFEYIFFFVLSQLLDLLLVLGAIHCQTTKNSNLFVVWRKVIPETKRSVSCPVSCTQSHITNRSSFFVVFLDVSNIGHASSISESTGP